MAIFSLHAEERDPQQSRAELLRKQGEIPAQVYGGKDTNRPITVSAKEFAVMLKSEGEGIVLNLQGPSFSEACIIQEIQRDPISDAVLHVDFLRIDMDQKVELEVPLEFVGVAPAVKEMSGILVKNLSEVEISALPSHVPRVLRVDLSKLVTFDDQILVSDIAAVDGVEILTNPEISVAIVEPPRSDEELAKLDEEVVEDVGAVESVKEKPEATEDEEAAEEKKPTE